jgi:hypothetical protein
MFPDDITEEKLKEIMAEVNIDQNVIIEKFTKIKNIIATDFIKKKILDPGHKYIKGRIRFSSYRYKIDIDRLTSLIIDIKLIGPFYFPVAIVDGIIFDTFNNRIDKDKHIDLKLSLKINDLILLNKKDNILPLELLYKLAKYYNREDIIGNNLKIYLKELCRS